MKEKGEDEVGQEKEEAPRPAPHARPPCTTSLSPREATAHSRLQAQQTIERELSGAQQYARPQQ